MAWTELHKIGANPVGIVAEHLHGYVGFLALAKELIQNADDAGVTTRDARGGRYGAKTVRFRFFSNRVEVNNDGPPFDEADLRAIAEINSGHKQRTERAAGYFGAGFGAVYSITDTPEIRSNGRRVRLNWERMVLECDADLEPDGKWTSIILPFRRDRTSVLARFSQQAAVVEPHQERQFERVLRAHLTELLLFLRNVRAIEVYIETLPKSPTWVAFRNGDTVTLSKYDPRKNALEVLSTQRWFHAADTFASGSEGVGIARSREVELAVVLSTNAPDGLLYSVLPLDLKLGFKMMLNGHFIPDPTRRHVVETGPGGGAWNRAVIEALGKLIVTNVERLRDALLEAMDGDGGKAAAALYAALPLDERTILDLFREPAQRVHEALTRMAVLPDHRNRWQIPRNVYWVDPQQAERKIAAQCESLPIVHSGLTNRQLRYVYDALGVPQLTRKDLLSYLSSILTPGFQALDGNHPLVGTRNRLEDLIRYVLSQENRSEDWARVRILPCIPDRRRRLTSPTDLIVPTDEDQPAVEVLLKLQHADLSTPDSERTCDLLEPHRAELKLSGLTVSRILAVLVRALPPGPLKPQELGWTVGDLQVLYDHLQRAWIDNQTAVREDLRRLQMVPVWLTQDGSLRASTLNHALRVKGSESLPSFLPVDDVIHAEFSTGDMRTFLRSGVGFSELGTHEFIRDYLLRQWPDLTDKVRHEALRWLREAHMDNRLVVPGQPSLTDQLRQAQLVPTKQGDWRRGADVFFPSPWLTDIVGPQAPVIDPKVSPKITPELRRSRSHEKVPDPLRWERFWHLLDVQRFPSTSDLVAVVDECLVTPEPERRTRIQTVVHGLDRMVEDLRHEDDWGEILQTLTTGLEPLQKLHWIPAEGRTDLMRPRDVAPPFQRLRELAGHGLLFTDVRFLPDSVLPDLLKFHTEVDVAEVLAHLDALASTGAPPSAKVYQWLAEHRQDLPRKKDLSDRFLIYENGRYYRPRDLLLVETGDFGDYRPVIPESAPSQLKDLYRALGARSIIEATDYLDVLEEIAAKAAKNPIPPDQGDESVIRSAYRWLARAAAERKLPQSAELHRRLILTQDGRLDFPDKTLWEDNPHWGALAKVAAPQFCRLRDATFLPWYLAAGVRPLTSAMRRELERAEGEQPAPDISTRLRARWPFLRRIILHFGGAPEKCEDWLSGLQTFLATRLQIKGSIEGLGGFSSTEELAWVESEGDPARLVITPGYEGLAAGGQCVGEVLLQKAGLGACVEGALFIQIIARVVEAPEEGALGHVLDVSGVRRDGVALPKLHQQTRYLTIPVLESEPAPSKPVATFPEPEPADSQGPSGATDGVPHRTVEVEADIADGRVTAPQAGSSMPAEQENERVRQRRGSTAPLAPETLSPTDGKEPQFEPTTPHPSPSLAGRRTDARAPVKPKPAWTGVSARYEGNVRLQAPRGTNNALRALGYHLDQDKKELEERITAAETAQPETGVVTIVLRAEALYLGVIELPDAAEKLCPLDRSEFRLTTQLDRRGVTVKLDRARHVLFNQTDLPHFLWAHDWPPGTILTLSRTGTFDEFELRTRPAECVIKNVIRFTPDERGAPRSHTDPEVRFHIQVDEDVYRSARRWEELELMTQPVDEGVITAIVHVLQDHAAHGEIVVNESTLRHEVFARRRCSYASVAIALRQRPHVFERVGTQGWRLLPPRERPVFSHATAPANNEAPALAPAGPADDSEAIVPWLNRARARMSTWAEHVDPRLALQVLRPMLQQLSHLVRQLEDVLAVPERSRREPPVQPALQASPPSVEAEPPGTPLLTLAERLKTLRKVDARDPATVVRVLRGVAEAVGGSRAHATAAVLYLVVARLEAGFGLGTKDAVASLRCAEQHLELASLRQAAVAVHAAAERVGQGVMWPGTGPRSGPNAQQVREKGCVGMWWLAAHTANRELFDTHLRAALAVVDLPAAR